MRKLAFRYRRIKELYNSYRSNVGGETLAFLVNILLEIKNIINCIILQTYKRKNVLDHFVMCEQTGLILNIDAFLVTV